MSTKAKPSDALSRGNLLEPLFGNRSATRWGITSEAATVRCSTAHANWLDGNFPDPSLELECHDAQIEQAISADNGELAGGHAATTDQEERSAAAARRASNTGGAA
jgi:hypothetical protein